MSEIARFFRTHIHIKGSYITLNWVFPSDKSENANRCFINFILHLAHLCQEIVYFREKWVHEQNKMAFESVKPILDFMGLILVPGTTNMRTHYIKNVLFTVPMLLLLCSLGAYFLVNLSNLMKATEVFYVIAATLLCIGQYWFLVSQKESLWLVLINLQKLVDHSKFRHVPHNLSFCFELNHCPTTLRITRDVVL